MYLTERSKNDSWLYRENPNDIFSNWSPPKLLEAEKWKQEVLGLPRSLNKKTWNKWWPVAQTILEADWKANPVGRDKLFKSVEGSAKGQIRTKKTDPIALSRSLQTESRNLIIKSVREGFEKIAARLD